MFQPKSLLIYGHKDLLGDAFIKLPFLRALRAGFPQAKVSWYVGSGNTVFLSVLKNIAKDMLHEVIQGPEPLSLDVFKKGSPWHRHFDLVVDTQRNLGIAWMIKRIPHTKFISPAGGFILSDYKPNHKISQLAAQLVSLVECCTGPLDIGSSPLVIPKDLLKKAKSLIPMPAIGLVPGAGGRYKCWPLERYIELAQWLSSIGCAPVFLLGPQEQDWKDLLKKKVPNALFPLDQADSVEWSLAIGKQLAGAIANDCGGGHLLGAVDVPLVSLFGPTTPDKFAPLTSRITILKAQDFGGEEMDRIPLEAVKQAVEGLVFSG